MHDVICLGSATMDVFVETEKNTMASECSQDTCQNFITYRSGEKLLIKELHFEVGGGGTNTAVCFAKLSLKAGYVGNIGSDLNGEQVLTKLKEEKVDFLGTRSDDLTNYSIILESTLIKDRTILVYKGASEHLHLRQLPSFASKWVYISSLAGESFETAHRILENCRKDGSKIAFNPSNYQIEQHKDQVLLMAAQTEVLILNREEASLLAGEGTEQQLLERLRALGPHIVVVTMGSRGVIASDGERYYLAQPKPNLPVRETTGAGDCFASTFVAALIYGKNVDEAIRWGLVNVENHIQHVGAKAGLLTKSELQFAVLQDNRTIHVS